MTYAVPVRRGRRSRGLGLLPGDTFVVPPEPTSGTYRTGTVVRSPYPTAPPPPPPGGVVTTPPTIAYPPIRPPTISPTPIPGPTEQGGQVKTSPTPTPEKPKAPTSSSAAQLPSWWPWAAGGALLLVLARGR